MDNEGLQKKVHFYENVYIPLMRQMMNDFLYEITYEPLMLECEPKHRNEKAIEILANINALLKEPRVVEYGESNNLN